MRKKIAKRIRRECLRRGVEIVQERVIREAGWKRKDCGVVVEARYSGWNISALGYDYLEAYKSLYQDLIWCEQNPIVKEET